MRMFTKIGATLATGALPVLLWAGSAGAQQSPDTTQSQSQTTQSQSQSQSPSTVDTPTTPTLVETTGGGTLARTGADDLLPLALGGVAIAGAVAVRGARRRSTV